MKFVLKKQQRREYNRKIRMAICQALDRGDDDEVARLESLLVERPYHPLQGMTDIGDLKPNEMVEGSSHYVSGYHKVCFIPCNGKAIFYSSFGALFRAHEGGGARGKSAVWYDKFVDTDVSPRWGRYTGCKFYRMS